MIIGIGTDIVELGRIRKIMEESAGQRFVQRILTPAEQALAEQRKARKYEFVAGRFAAKEAVSKAFGCGIGGKVGLQDMEIVPDSNGKPGCTLSEGAWTRLGLNPDKTRIHLSITHSEESAAAFAVIEDIGS